MLVVADRPRPAVRLDQAKREKNVCQKTDEQADFGYRQKRVGYEVVRIFIVSLRAHQQQAIAGHVNQGEAADAQSGNAYD
jgi:hypothetical protein